MTPEEINLPIRSHDEVMILNKEEVIDQISAEDFVNHSPGIPEDQRRGRDAVRAHNRYLHSAFSDIALVNESPVIEGDMIGFRWIFSATHTGETGKRITIEGFDVMKIRNGKITDAWVYQDTAGLFIQLQMPADS
jgi:ketosteroid isomerase-like protein